MNSAELKIDLIHKIITSNDEVLLKQIEEILDTFDCNLIVNEPPTTYEKKIPEEIYVLNEWQRKRIDIALKQIENGECISDEEAQKEIEKWFEEQE